jgi:hypothetical protein
MTERKAYSGARFLRRAPLSLIGFLGLVGSSIADPCRVARPQDRSLRTPSRTKPDSKRRARRVVCVE